MKSEWNSFEGGAEDQNKQGTSRKNADGWVHRSLQYLLRYFEKLQASATQRAAARRVTLLSLILQLLGDPYCYWHVKILGETRVKWII
jgi:hypothetical protein